MDRNTLSALLLIALILVLTPYYLELVTPTKRRAIDSLSVESAEAPPRQTTNFEEPPPQTTENPPPIPRIEAVDERVFSIETDLYFAEISSRAGGSINSFILKNNQLLIEKYASLSIFLSSINRSYAGLFILNSWYLHPHLFN